MIQVNTNIPSLVSARILSHQNEHLQTAMTRLGTGLRINTGKDDPAGIIASEGLLAEQSAIKAATYNISRANNFVAAVDGGLGEISKLLIELEDLVDKSANESGISEDEHQANQLQIDSILDSINRIATSTEFQGRKVLNGELDYVTSNADATNFSDVKINSARIANGSSLNVIVDVTASAQVGTLTYAASATGAGTTTLEVTGNYGTETLSFASGTGIADIVTAINQSKDLTGVSAVATSATGLQFYSLDYGSDSFVSVRALEGTFTVTGGDSGDTKDYGRDATISVNGVTAITDGLHARFKTAGLSAELDLTASFGTAIGSTSFQILGGGADFMISPTVSLNGLASIGVKAVSTSSLGSRTIGFISSLGSGQTNAVNTGNYATSQRIVRAAASQVADLRGRIGAFQKDTLDTARNSLEVMYENITAAGAAIREADFAEETSKMTRQQILVQAATSVLRIANQQPQLALSLLS